jgi:hypothetical protein
VIDRESTMCSCTEICKHQQKIDKHTHCAADNYNCLHACDPDFKFEPDIEHATNDPVSEILPNLPTLLRLEDMKAYIDNEIQKAVKPLSEKIDKLEEENVRLRRHVSILEGHLNINYADYEDVCLTGNTYEDLKDEGITPLCDQIKELTNRIEQPLSKSTESIEIELPVIPSTTLEHKASALIEHLKEKVKPRNDAVFMNSNEIINFLKCELPEGLRIKEDIRNPRQAKKDILEKAVKLFSNSVMIIKNKSGNKVTGIALKPSVKRRYTDTC